MKFRIKDEEHSKAIQEKLFSLGYKWCGESGSRVKHTDKPFLYLDGDGIGFSTLDGTSDTFFEDYASPEYVLLDGEFVPADSVPEAVAEAAVEGPVTSDGSSSAYYKLRITNRKGDTIECETGDVIAALVGDNFPLGNVVKALRRIYECANGRGKVGTDMSYDVEKCKYFLDDFAARYGKKS